MKLNKMTPPALTKQHAWSTSAKYLTQKYTKQSPFVIQNGGSDDFDVTMMPIDEQNKGGHGVPLANYLNAQVRKDDP